MIEHASWGLGAVLVGLTLLAAVVAGLNQLGVARGVVYAVARAVLQLAAVSLILVWVLRSGWWTAGFIALMLVIASWTSARRIGAQGRNAWWTFIPISAGLLPVLTSVLATGAVPLEPEAVLPISGIVLGGAMTGTSLVGRLAVAELRDRWGEYEAALSVGLIDREAALMLIRPQASQALVPAMDQTRTVGLVTLPGAFVGVMLGGGSPAQAGAAQILVLVGILTAQIIAMVITLEILARDPAA